jgi:glycosyltransferase involved in cell wall biosynthesis
MSSYNSSEYLENTIRSIQKQSYLYWELLITDDCSTDNSVEIVAAFAVNDSRIKLFRLNVNSGAGMARNNSIKHAKGRFIAFCDSDDLWKPNKLEKQLKFIKDNGYKFIFCQSEIIDENNKIIGFNKRRSKVSFRSTTIINYIGTSGVLYDTNDIGIFYMKDIRKRQDWVLWLDILFTTKYAYCLQEPLSSWRKNKNSLSAKKGNLLGFHITIYRNVLNYSILKSYFTFYCLSLPCYAYKKITMKIDSIRYLKNIQKYEKTK